MTEQSQTGFHMVGIGASAGGLEALEKLFSNMEPGNNLAFVVVQHLSPDYKSHMVELLSKYTKLDVFEAEDGMKVAPDAIYLIPPRKNMTTFKGKLYLVDYAREQGLNLPIDIFLQSLAEDQREKAVAIILSGTGSDGTRGIRAIKEAGGMVMAQDDSAKFDGMPRSAIQTQLVDFVAAPEEMPAKLLNYLKHPCLVTDPTTKLVLDTDEALMDKLFAILQKHSEVDFSEYKPNTILRRVERRMSINQIEKLADYVAYLQQSPTECQALYKEFLIGVTRFFRDPGAFNFLQRKIFPRIFEGKTRQDQIRVWVAGCSTGEEAYSLAILFSEYMEYAGHHLSVKIFATDIDKNALDYASQGIYPESVLADVSAERLQNFFVNKGGSHEVSRHIRSMVVFANQNLLKDPPFSKMDLISCRNMLIYFKPALQKKVLGTFQFALQNGGYLFLGTSESVSEYSNVFSSVHNKWKIYQYFGNAISPLEQTRLDRQSDTQPNVGVKRYRQPKKVDDWRSSDTVLRSLVEQVMPPCVVVDENHAIIHAFGEVRQYLQAPLGYRVNLDILNMAQEALVLPLHTALNRAIREMEEVVYHNLKLNDNNGVSAIDLTVRPFWEQSQNRRLFLIIFERLPNQGSAEKPSEPFDVHQSAHQRITSLEQELQYTRENLQATIEELETTNEELQATNEELMAANEELQSTNEELQSVNEELITVNTEYQLKIKELTQLNDDVNNLLSSIDIGTVFLDVALNVRKFTPAAQAEINLLEQDIGRPFNHISHNFKNFDLLEEAKTVLETLLSSEHEIQSRNGTWYSIRTLPYITHTKQIGGVVLVLINISDLKSAEVALRESSAELEHQTQLLYSVLDTIDDGVVATDEEGHFLVFNPAAKQIIGQGPTNRDPELWLDHYGFLTPDGQALLPAAETPFLAPMQGKSFDETEALIRNSHTDRPTRISAAARPIRDKAGNIKGGVTVFRDITQQTQARMASDERERVFRQTLQDLPMAIFSQDRHLRHIWIHAPYPDLTIEEMTDKTDAELLPNDDLHEMTAVKQEALRSGCKTRKVVRITIHGQEYHYDLIVQPVEPDADDPSEIICTALDVSAYRLQRD